MLAMRNKKKMGRFSVELELANNNDLVRAAAGDLSPQEVRTVKIPGVVDSGASRLVIPESVFRQLGLQEVRKTRVRYADGRVAMRRMAAGIHLTYIKRDGVFDAIIERKRDTVLIGAIVMEVLDLVIDCTSQKLVPRDPKQILSEIE